MAWSHVNTTTAGDAAGTTLAYTRPSGAADGDLLVLHFYLENQTKTPSISPGSWTQVGSSAENVDGVNFEHWVYWNRMAGESGAITVSWDGTSIWRIGLVSAYSGGLASGDPLDGTPTNNVKANPGNLALVATGITTTVDGSLVVASGANSRGDTHTWTGVTERADFGGQSIADGVQATAGATGDKTAALTSANARWTAKLFALKIAAVTDPFPAGVVRPGLRSTVRRSK